MLEDKFPWIQGWLHPVVAHGIETLLRAQDEMSIFGNSLEIGVYKGKTIAHFISHRREEEFTFGVDPFVIYNPNEDLSIDFFDECRANIAELNKISEIKGQTILLRGISSSPDIQSYLANSSLGFRVASVDGSHLFEDCLQDLILASSLMNNNGVIIVDDFCNPLNAEVTLAVSQFLLRDCAWQPLLMITPNCSPRYGSTRLFLCKPSYYELYLESFVKAFSETIQREKYLFTDSLLCNINCIHLIPS